MLMEIREKYGAECVFTTTGGGGNPEVPSAGRFAHIFGTPNWFEPGCAQCYLPRVLACAMMYGGGEVSPRALRKETRGNEIIIHLSARVMTPDGSMPALMEIADDGKHVWFVTVSDDPEYSFPAAELPVPENDFSAAEANLADKEGELIACEGLMYKLKDYIPDLKNKENNAHSTPWKELFISKKPLSRRIILPSN